MLQHVGDRFQRDLEQFRLNIRRQRSIGPGELNIGVNRLVRSSRSNRIGKS